MVTHDKLAPQSYVHIAMMAGLWEDSIKAKLTVDELQTVFQRALNTYPDPSPQLLELADKIAAL